MKEMIVELIDKNCMPAKAHAEDACFDLFAREEVVVAPLSTVLVPAGFKIQLPKGWEAQIRGRSGNSLKRDMKVILGTIDCGYTGEVGVIVFNSNHNLMVNIEKGFKIAQMSIKEVPLVVLKEGIIDKETARGEGGFGSTGVK